MLFLNDPATHFLPQESGESGGRSHREFYERWLTAVRTCLSPCPDPQNSNEALRKHWERSGRFPCMVAHSDDVVEWLLKIRVDPFGNMGGNIDISFPHNLNCVRVESDRMGPGAHDLKLVTREMPKPSFCHLASAGITGTEKEHFLFHGVTSAGNRDLVLLHPAHTESITGTSTNTPTTVANAAPDSGPKSAIAVATANSKKLLAPMSAPGAATAYGTRHIFMSP